MKFDPSHGQGEGDWWEESILVWMQDEKHSS